MLLELVTSSITSVLLTIAIGLFFILALLLHNSLKYWKKKDVPHLKPIPLFGNFQDLVLGKKSLTDQIRSLYEEDKSNSPYLGIHLFISPYLMVKDPELIKQILVKDFHLFPNRSFAQNERLDPYSYHSLFTTKDNVWKSIRVKLSPVFTSGKMKLMMPLISQISEDLVCHFDKHINETLEVKEILSRFTVDTISLCAFGVNSNCLKSEDSIVRKMSKRLTDSKSLYRTFSILCYFFFPALVHILRLSFLDPKAARFLSNMFKETYEERKRNNAVRNDLIDLLDKIRSEETLNDNYKLDDIRMASQALSFFSAGNETSSAMLTYILYEITLQPDIQERLRKEVEDVGELNEKITYEQLQNLKYMEMVIKETLRKYPLTSVIMRESSEEYKFEKTGLIIEKNTRIIIPVSGLHFDPAYFCEPHKFDPERFNPDNKTKIVPYTFLPFGEGPRSCIGERFALMVLKVALCHLLRKFEFEPSEKTEIPLKIAKGAFLLPQNGVHLKVIKRSTN